MTDELVTTTDRAYRIRVILEQFEVLDDHDPWWLGPGEVRFFVRVTPDSDPKRAQITRLPAVGTYRMSPGTQLVERVIYDGLAPLTDLLEIAVSGVEEDLLTRDDRFVRYRRTFGGSPAAWAGGYRPDEEVDDPEAMSDWRVWYRIEVDPVIAQTPDDIKGVWAGIRRALYFMELRANPAGEVPRDLWKRAVAAKRRLRPPLPEDDDPGGGPPAGELRAALVGEAKAELRPGSDPLPNTSLGCVERFVRVEAEGPLVDTRLKLAITPEETSQVNPLSLRVFQYNEALNKMLLVPRSGLASNGSYVWASIRKPGLYGVYGLPRDRARLLTLQMLYQAREASPLYEAAGAGGQIIQNPLCKVILCLDELIKSGLLEDPAALEKIGFGDLVGDPYLLHGGHPGGMPTDAKGRPIGGPSEYIPEPGSPPPGDPLPGGLPPGSRRPKDSCQDCLGIQVPDDLDEWDPPEFQIFGDPLLFKWPGTWTLPAPSCEQWESMGPSNLAGRVKSLAFHPTNGNIVYAGVSEGGVWKSTDGGHTWYPKMHGELTLGIGAVAVAPSDPNIIYAATGEYLARGRSTASAYPGEGVYRSTDGGNDWDLMPPIESTRCSKVVVHPTNPNLVYVSGNWGIHRWDEALGEWVRISTLDATDLALDPANPSRLYAGVESSDGLIKTENAEASTPVWTPFNTGLSLPSNAPSQFNFVKIAISPSDPSVMYAIANAEQQKPDGSWDYAGAIVHRWDGTQWVDKGVRINNTQKYWCAVISVHPTDPDFIIAAGVGFSFSPDGGEHWYGRGAGHADNHSAVFHPTTPHITLVANDGGVWKHTGAPGQDTSDLVALHSPDAGGMDVFSRDEQNHLQHYWWRSTSGWGGWGDRGGSLEGRPAAVYSPDATGMDIFSQGTDGHLHHLPWRPGTGWGAWTDLGGMLDGSPAAVHSPDAGGIDVFARGPGNSLLHLPWRPGTGWSAWQDLGGNIAGDPVAVYSPDAGGLDIFVRGANDHLHHLPWRPGTAWGAWDDLGGDLMSNPTAVYSPDATGLDVFGRSSDRTLGHWAWRPGTGWAPYASRGSDISDEPFAHYSPELGGMDVYARGRFGDLRHIYWRPGTGWDEEGLGGFLQSGPTAVRPPELGGVDVFVRGGNHAMYRRWWRNASDGWGAYQFRGFDTDWKYESSNHKLVTIQFYNLSVAQAPPFAIGGSTQDQGILKSDGSTVYVGLGGNEGGLFEVDPNNGNTIYWDPWDGDLRRTDSGTSTGQRDATNGIESINGDIPSLYALAIHPNDSDILISACPGPDDKKRVYRSSDGAAPAPASGWGLVVDNVGNRVRNIVFAPSDNSKVYFTTDNGEVWRSDDTGQTFVRVSDASLPSGDLRGLAVDWNDPEVVYVSYRGSGLGFGHVWMSEDGGVGWRDISGALPHTRLPDLPFSAIVQQYNRPETLYASTEVGVFRTTDGGDWWYPFDEGLPNAVVTYMDYRRASNTLYVSTIGRGMWRRQV